MVERWRLFYDRQNTFAVLPNWQTNLVIKTNQEPICTKILFTKVVDHQILQQHLQGKFILIVKLSHFTLSY